LQADQNDTAQQADQDTAQPANPSRVGTPSSSQRQYGQSESSQSGKAEKFIQKALQGGKMEVQMGRLAQQKGQSQEVKDLGAALVKDHTAANQKLQQLASSTGGPAGSATGTEHAEHGDHAHGKDAKHDQMMNKLQTQSGAEFDKAFVRMAIKDHKKDISEFEKARREVNQPQLTSFIDQTLPTLRNHLQMAQTAARAVGVDAAQITADTSDDADSAAGAAAGSVQGTSEQNSSDTLKSNSDTSTSPDNDRSSLDQNDSSATVKGNVGDHEFKADADLNKDNASTSTTESGNKIFQKGDGKVLGLSTDKNDGKFLGIIPASKKDHDANAEVNIDTDDSAVGSSGASETGTSSQSSDSAK
jgi:putative membrane protein